MSNPATTYENYFVPVLFAPLVPSLLATARPQRGERILDAGCGSGIVARRVAAHLGGNAAVTGLDPSPAMLATAVEVADREGVGIEWIEGVVESMPFPDGSFDLVLCQQVLQFCRDRPAALGAMRRVLTDGGRLVLSMWLDMDHFPLYERMDAAIEKHLGSAAMETAFSGGSAEDLRDLLIETGFRDVELDVVEFKARYPQLDRYVALQIASSSAAIPALQHLDGEARAALTAAIEEEMRPTIARFTVGDEMVTPALNYLARAVR